MYVSVYSEHNCCYSARQGATDYSSQTLSDATWNHSINVYCEYRHDDAANNCNCVAGDDRNKPCTVSGLAVPCSKAKVIFYNNSAGGHSS